MVGMAVHDCCLVAATWCFYTTTTTTTKTIRNRCVFVYVLWWRRSGGAKASFSSAKDNCGVRFPLFCLPAVLLLATIGLGSVCVCVCVCVLCDLCERTVKSAPCLVRFFPPGGGARSFTRMEAPGGGCGFVDGGAQLLTKVSCFLEGGGGVRLAHTHIQQTTHPMHTEAQSESVCKWRRWDCVPHWMGWAKGREGNGVDAGGAGSIYLLCIRAAFLLTASHTPLCGLDCLFTQILLEHTHLWTIFKCVS